MNGTWKAFAAAGSVLALAVIPAIYAYGQTSRDVLHNGEMIVAGDARNAQAIGKNEAAIAANRERATKNENSLGIVAEQIGHLRRDVGKVQNTLDVLLGEVRRGNGQ